MVNEGSIDSSIRNIAGFITVVYQSLRVEASFHSRGLSLVPIVAPQKLGLGIVHLSALKSSGSVAAHQLRDRLNVSKLNRKKEQSIRSLRYAPGTPRHREYGPSSPGEKEKHRVRGRSFRQNKFIHSRSYGGMQQIPGRAGSSLHTFSNRSIK
jgi:hypothetical protein